MSRTHPHQWVLSIGIVKVISLQVIVTVLAVGILAMWLGVREAKSAFIGGAIGFIPALVYAIRIFKTGRAAPEKLLRAHYAGEFSKFVLTALMFALTFALLKDISVVVLFLTYLLTLTTYWIALIFYKEV